MSNLLTPQEVTVTQMALSGMIEDLEAVGKDPKLPFTPEARKHQKEILEAARSAHLKFAAASGMVIQLDPYKEGDEKEFLTKES
jgi:hypothetical protein